MLVQLCRLTPLGSTKHSDVNLKTLQYFPLLSHLTPYFREDVFVAIRQAEHHLRSCHMGRIIASKMSAAHPRWAYGSFGHVDLKLYTYYYGALYCCAAIKGNFFFQGQQNMRF